MMNFQEFRIREPRDRYLELVAKSSSKRPRLDSPPEDL